MPDLVDFKRINPNYLANPTEIDKDKNKHFLLVLSGLELKVSPGRNNKHKQVF